MVTQVRWQSPSHVDILGISVDRVTMDEAMAAVESFIATKEPHLVVTADASGIVIAQDDPEFKQLLLEADLVTPDSSGILWASARLGQPIADRVSGVDMVDRICALSADKGYRLFFLGAAPGVAETAAEKLRLKHPGCNIVGTRHGYFPSDSDGVVAKEVAEFRPDVLFVAMGIPRQEKFIKATQDIIQAPVAMGVGGSFDVFSGRTKRAPKFVQRMRMEWLWRLILNPKKFAKAKTLPRFMTMVLRSRR
jgi:N-acetylglucosaminyldiphosphoundecaprenol N-acetyl-beta-D-mannosaminyltransferase